MEEYEQVTKILAELSEKYCDDSDTFKKLNDVATLVTLLVLKGCPPRSS